MSKFKEILILTLLFFCWCVPLKAAASDCRQVTFLADDGITIAGVYAAPRGNKTTFILLHGLGSTKEEWEPLEKKLSKEGYGFLAYDARGHGESTVTGDGSTVTYQSFGKPVPGSHWHKMTRDLDRAVKFLERRKPAESGPIGLMGASLGANVCIVYAAATPRIPVVVALSAGMNYANIEPARSIGTLTTRRVLFAASASDAYAFESTIALYRQLSKAGGKTDIIYGESGHGVQMFNERFEDRLLRWIAGS